MKEEIHKIGNCLKRSFLCPYGCEKSFTERSNLMIHIKIHLGEKPYACTYDGCCKRFITLGNLRSHSKTHNSIKLRCSFNGCNKSYSHKNRLSAHLKSHAGIRTFVCSYEGCSKYFNDKWSMSVHLNKHLGIANFRCYINNCKESFITSVDLKSHLKTHNPFKSQFFCTRCDSTFSRYDSIITHNRTHLMDDLTQKKRVIFSTYKDSYSKNSYSETPSSKECSDSSFIPQKSLISDQEEPNNLFLIENINNCSSNLEKQNESETLKDILLHLSYDLSQALQSQIQNEKSLFDIQNDEYSKAIESLLQIILNTK